MRILLVEDEPGLANSLGAYLRAEGFTLNVARTFNEAQQAARQAHDLVILDWMLPDGQGIELLKDWRRGNLLLPIIMLTAKSEIIDKVLGLELGANDYITKPFEPRELLARIHAHLRTSVHFESRIVEASKDSKKSPSITISDIELDPAFRTVSYLRKRIELTRMEFELLHTLLRAPNQVFSRSELLNQVWGYDKYPTTRTVDNHISQLRRKISPDLFEIVRRVGYRFVPRS